MISPANKELLQFIIRNTRKGREISYFFIVFPLLTFNRYLLGHYDGKIQNRSKFLFSLVIPLDNICHGTFFKINLIKKG